MTVGTEAERAGPRQWLGLAVLLTGFFMAGLDTFIVFLAIPTIQSSFGMTYAQAEMVIAGYALTLGVGLITAGRLGDRFGRRRLYSIGVFGFTATSALCGIAQSTETLVIARLLQGLSASILSPQVLAIIRVEFSDPRDRASAFGWMGFAGGLSAVTGNLVGGLILSANLWGLTWRPFFLLNVPVGIAMLLVAPFVLRESRSDAAEKVDLLGILLSTLGLGLLMYPLMEGREAGWPSWTILMLAGAAVLLGNFAAHQHFKTRRGTAPLLDTSLFSEPGFSPGAILILIFYAQNAPFLLFLTYLLQKAMAMDPLHAGLTFAPMPISFALASYISGRVPAKNAKRWLFAGVLISSIGALVFLVASSFPSSLSFVLLPALIITGTGQGLFMTPVLNVVLNKVREWHIGAASGVLVTVQRVGNALGVAVLGIPFFYMLDRYHASDVPVEAAYAGAFSAMMVIIIMIYVVVGVLLLRLPDAANDVAE